MISPAPAILMACLCSLAPDALIQMPIDPDSGFTKKILNLRFIAIPQRPNLNINRRRNHKAACLSGILQGLARLGIRRVIFIPECDENT